MSNPFKMKDKQQMDQSLKGQLVTEVVLPSLQKAASSVWDGWNDRTEPLPPAPQFGVRGCLEQWLSLIFGLQTP